MCRVHKLKIKSEYFSAVINKTKTAEIFDVFLQGFRAAVEFQLIDKNNNKGE